MHGRAGGRGGSPKMPKPKVSRNFAKPHPDTNPLVRLFGRLPVFKQIFKDPKLDYIDNFATIMFFVSVLLVMISLPYSLVRCPWFSGLRRRFGSFATWVLWLLDWTIKIFATFASLTYIWVPINRGINRALTTKDPYAKYIKDADKVTSFSEDNSNVVFVSYVVAATMLTGSLVLFLGCLQQMVADDPEVLVQQLEEVKRRQIEVTKRGSGDMPSKDKEETDEPVRVRKTPLRSCRSRSTFGRDATQENK